VKFIKLNTISRKYLVSTLTFTAVLLVALGVFMAGQNLNAIEETMDEKGNAVADFITRFSAEYFAIFDFTDFENIEKAVASDPDVEYFVLYNSQGEALTANSPPEDTSALLVYSEDIKDEFDNVLGRLEIGYNKRSLAESQKKSTVTILVSMVVAISLLAVGMAVLTRRLVISRVNNTVDMLKDIAQGEGDLTKRLSVNGNDELSELATWFNTFVVNIQNIIVAVKASVEKSSSASHQLASTADELNQGAQEQAMQTEQVATAMTEMSQTIVDVAKNAGDAAGASHEASETAAKGREVVDGAVQGMLKIAKTVSEASESIGTLGESSSEIGNIIQVIDEIADQTNLLALNAAIEAARAGEHGRGFAVVADEVRKLAERTGKATKEIAEMIEKIQTDTDLSVSSMQTGKKEVQGGVELAEEARKSLDLIVKSSDKGETMVHRIAAASEEQSSAAEQVSQNMENILNIARHSAQSTSQIKSTSQELEKLSLELQRMIQLFKV
jgi:methyl-accepting chemotaxis protein